MCYAIPGKVISVKGRAITVEYFGELRKAHNVDYSLEPGEYIYAQGGIVVGKIPESEALPILKTWEKQFFELKKVDAGLSSAVESADSTISLIIKKADSTGTLNINEMLAVLNATNKQDLHLLFSDANRIRKEKLGNACCVHGIIEFSNYCVNKCLYCGIRCNNRNLNRYRMTEKEILDAVGHSVNDLGFKAMVLQSGEDPQYTDDMLVDLVRKIRERHGILIFMSIGERSLDCYNRLYDAGAYGALLRFETSNESIYQQVRPGKKLKDRLALIREIKEMGFVLATGFLIGLPGQTSKDIVEDILLTKSLKPDMYSFGPFIPHQETPLATAKKTSINDVLKIIALSRLVDHESKILVTTALETLSSDAQKAGLLAGANSLMIDTTPQKYQKAYDLYPGKAKDETVQESIKKTVKLLHSLGRAPTDLGI